MASVLVVNAGSTSLKLSVVDEDDWSVAIPSLAEASREVAAVAHRVVHGGSRFREPVLIDEKPSRIWDWSDPQFFRPVKDAWNGASLHDVVLESCSAD